MAIILANPCKKEKRRNMDITSELSLSIDYGSLCQGFSRLVAAACLPASEKPSWSLLASYRRWLAFFVAVFIFHASSVQLAGLIWCRMQRAQTHCIIIYSHWDFAKPKQWAEICLDRQIVDSRWKWQNQQPSLTAQSYLICFWVFKYNKYCLFKDVTLFL